MDLNEYDANKLIWGHPDKIKLKLEIEYSTKDFDEYLYHARYGIYIKTNEVSMHKYCYDDASEQFKNIVHDISKYFDVPSNFYQDLVSKDRFHFVADNKCCQKTAKYCNPFSISLTELEKEIEHLHEQELAEYNETLRGSTQLESAIALERRTRLLYEEIDRILASGHIGKNTSEIINIDSFSSITFINTVFFSKEYLKEKEKLKIQQQEQEAIRHEVRRKQQEEQKKEEEKREREYGWFNVSSNNVDMRLPAATLTESQQNQIVRICSSQSITIFEDFDEHYCIMYFEIQPSSFAESMRFAFKQISSSGERLAIRNTKECRNCALRAIMPIFDLLSQNYEKLEEEKIFDLVDGKLDRICLHRIETRLSNTFGTINAEKQNRTIFRPIQLFIPPGAHKCALSDGKEGNYDDYKAFIECGFDVGDSTNYIYYENSLTVNDDNYWQCPVPNVTRRKAKGDIINVLKNAGFFADFEVIEKFKAKGIKTLIMNR